MTDSDTQSSSQELPLLTFNSLYNVLREEKKGKSLQQLPELFYEALEKFLTDKKEEIKRLKVFDLVRIEKVRSPFSLGYVRTYR